MKNNIYLGMSMQAFITGILTLTGITEFRPGAQIIAGIIFFILWLSLKSNNKVKSQSEIKV